MKTILLIAALTGFTAIGGYAQNKNCACKHKMQQRAAAVRNEDNVIHTTLLLAPVREEVQQPCVTFKKDDMIITACPIVSDNAGLIQGNLEGTFMGNYPVVCAPQKAADGSVVLDCEPKNAPAESQETEAPLYNPPMGLYEIYDYNYMQR